ncbi:MAG: hypothetical protein IH940_12485, partial [Acidobacteria bacterium]|nr:hypothetical protein [Acidobacteriota bacterium]
MDTETTDNELRSFFAMLRRRWLIVVLCGTMIGGLAFVSASEGGQTYQSNAQLLIELRRPVDLANRGSVDERIVANELAILNGQGTLNRVYEKTGDTVVPSAKGVEDQDVLTLSAKSTRPAAAQDAVAAQLEIYVAERGRDFAEAVDLIDLRLAEIDTQIASRDTDQALKYYLRVERIDLQNVQADLRPAVTSGGVAIVSRAGLPTKSKDLSPIAIGIAGLLVGLVIGAGIAGLIEHLDPRIRRATDLRTVTGASVVTTVGGRVGSTVVLRGAPESAQADVYRSLVTALAHGGVGDSISSLHIAAVDNAAAGSLVAANLAVGFSRAGVDTVIACVDPWDASLHAHFGLDNSLGISDVAQGHCSLTDAIQWLDGELALSVMTIGERFARPGELAMHPAWRRTICEVIDLSTLSILDGGVVSGRPAIASIVSDATVLVTTTSTTSEELESAIVALKAIGARVIACVEAGSVGRVSVRRRHERVSNIDASKDDFEQIETTSNVKDEQESSTEGATQPERSKAETQTPKHSEHDKAKGSAAAT